MLFLKAALDFKIVARSRGENTDCGDVKTELRKVSQCEDPTCCWDYH